MRNGTSTTKPAIGPGHADVEERALRRERLADANDRAERAREGHRRGNEVGQRRVHVVVAAREVVAELVGAEDGEQRHASTTSPFVNAAHV